MGSLSEEEIQKKLVSFQCQRCNECCKKPGFVYLNPSEAENIADFLQIDTYQFTDKFCEIVDRSRLVLKKHEDEACIFLTESGCQIHEVKPEQCKVFPYAWRTAESFDYCDGLKKFFR